MNCSSRKTGKYIEAALPDSLQHKVQLPTKKIRIRQLLTKVGDGEALNTITLSIPLSTTSIRCRCRKYEKGFQHLWNLASGWAKKN